MTVWTLTGSDSAPRVLLFLKLFFFFDSGKYSYVKRQDCQLQLIVRDGAKNENSPSQTSHAVSVFNILYFGQTNVAFLWLLLLKMYDSISVEP